MIKYYLIALFSGFLSSFSQILLKKSAIAPKESIFKEYINLYVIGGYAITIICMLLMIVAYRGMPFKYGAVIESLTYLYVMVLSKIFLEERITFRKFMGNLMIISGVVLFGLGN